MDKKHKFNWVDGFIILAVVVVGLGVFWRMTGQVQSATATTQEFSYTVEVKRVRQATVDAIDKSVGQKFNMNDKARTDDMGVLVDYKARPAQKELEMANGTAKLADVPERFDVTLTFMLNNGQVNNLGFYTPQLSNIGAGATVIARSKFVQVQGNVGWVTPAVRID